MRVQIKTRFTSHTNIGYASIGALLVMDERLGEAATDLHAAILLYLDMHLGIRSPVYLVNPALEMPFLVPKLCLGTHSAKLRFAPPSLAWEADAKQSFAKSVPKQSLGTRGCHF